MEIMIGLLVFIVVTYTALSLLVIFSIAELYGGFRKRGKHR